MANGFSDLLSRIASPFYEGRDIDEEERRRIEELRAQGVYVPQERQTTPFGYGSGRRRREDLTAIRKAIQPDQQRRMAEHLARAGEQERQRMAREKQNTAIQIATENQARLADLKRRQGDTFDPQSGQSFGDYLRARVAKPPLSPDEEAELKVRQRRLLPVRKEEAAVAQAEQGVAEGAVKYPTVVAQERDKQETLALAAKVRGLLSPEYAGLLAQGTEMGLQFQNKLLEAKLSVENSAAGRAIRQQTANNEEAQARIDALILRYTNEWLNSGSPDAQAFRGMGGQTGLDIADQLNMMEARLLQAAGSGLTGGLRDAFSGNQPRRPGSGRRGAVAVTDEDEELQGQPRAVRPPITGQGQAPRQPITVPRRGQRPMRQTQPQTQPAPISSPAQRRQPPEWSLFHNTRKAGGPAADKAIFAQKDSLVSEIADITRVFTQQGRTQPRFRIDIERLADAKAKLRALVAAYPWLNE